jgi:hypothetical protein
MGILARYKHRLLPWEPFQGEALKYSHAEFLLWSDVDSVLYTIGARGSKHEMISRADEYYTGQEILIKYPVIPLTDNDNQQAWEYFGTLTNRYQYGVFLSWITYLKSKVWIGSKGDKRNNCYELAARLANSVDRWPSDVSLDRVSIYDLYGNHYYKKTEQ